MIYFVVIMSVVAWIGLSYIISVFAAEKNRNSNNWFWLAFLTSPLLAAIFLIAAGSNNVNRSSNIINTIDDIKVIGGIGSKTTAITLVCVSLLVFAVYMIATHGDRERKASYERIDELNRQIKENKKTQEIIERILRK
ncbi:MAG: hypothetical protein ACYC7K_05580 [Desulfobacteria bacterium]